MLRPRMVVLSAIAVIIVLTALYLAQSRQVPSEAAAVPEAAPVPEPDPEPLPASLPEIRQALLDELKTVTLKNCTLKRYGSADDGGYLMCENLASAVESAYSYGIATEDNWGCDVSRQFRVPIHQYDCFTGHRPTCDGGQFVFHAECVGGKRETIDEQLFDTIASQIARNGDAGKRLVVKIDVEGAEWDSLLAIPDSVFDQIVQIPMEFHGTDEAKFVRVIRRMKRQFHLVNLHFNNHDCRTDLGPFPSPAYQVLWVNKEVGVLDPDGPSPAPMSPLNMPDRPTSVDCQLPITP